MKSFKKIFFTFLAFSFLFAHSFVSVAHGATPQQTFMERLKKTAETGRGYSPASSTTLAVAVGVFIRTVLGFVGVIFLGLVIYAGILWMTARGNEDKAGDARKIMMNASIGLGITLAAYIITQTVIVWLS